MICSSHSGCVLQHDAVGCGVLTRVVLGILHPRRVELDTFPQDEAMRGVSEGI